MNKVKRLVAMLFVGAGAFLALWLYPPWLGDEPVYHDYRNSGRLLDAADDDVPPREVRSRPAGYAWRFTGPQRRGSEVPSECTYRVDSGRLAWHWALLQVGLCLAVIVLRPELIVLDAEPVVATTWREFLAARVPAVVGGVLSLVWILPILTFLAYTLDGRSFIPVIGLTLGGVVLGNRLSAGWFRLRQAEADGRVYALLGVRHFRNFVSDGDFAIRLMRRIDPSALGRFSRPKLAKWEQDTRVGERAHVAWLLGSVPSMVWAVVVNELWFAAYLLAANIAYNVYPIMLRRYTRARLARIRDHPRCQAK